MDIIEISDSDDNAAPRRGAGAGAGAAARANVAASDEVEEVQIQRAVRRDNQAPDDDEVCVTGVFFWASLGTLGTCARTREPRTKYTSPTFLSRRARRSLFLSSAVCSVSRWLPGRHLYFFPRQLGVLMFFIPFPTLAA